MKILVTGGAGFIGSHIVDALIEKNHEVHIVDNLITGFRHNIHPKATFHEIDIYSPEVKNIIEKEKFEVIFHKAAQMDVRKSVADPVYDANINIIGSLNLLESGIKSGLKKFIFASSGGTVYGEQVEFPANESHSKAPISPYGITKLALENYLHYYAVQYGLKSVTLRYANVYGPRQNPHGEAGVVAIFAKKIYHQEQAFVNGDGQQTRDYVFVEDVVNANMLALESEESGAFNVGTAVETNVVQLFDYINAYFKNPIERQFAPAKPGEQQRSVLDCSLIKEKLSWEPKFDIELGLNKTCKWFEEKFRAE